MSHVTPPQGGGALGQHREVDQVFLAVFWEGESVYYGVPTERETEMVE
jgi:hypothetical protein